MSVASSIPCIKIPNPSFCSSPSSSSSSSSSNSYSYYFYRSSKPKPLALFSTTISCSEGPIRRPAAPPPLRDQPSSPSPPNPPVVKPAPPSPPLASVAQSPQPKLSTVGDGRNLITLEFQRQKAKELQEYFKQKKLEEANEGPFFGFIGKNEISNGRWAMFGFAVGMLTEYATGSDLVDQVKILLSNFGIVDLD